jgi:hypothetical protein
MIILPLMLIIAVTIATIFISKSDMAEYRIGAISIMWLLTTVMIVVAIVNSKPISSTPPTTALK